MIHGTKSRSQWPAPCGCFPPAGEQQQLLTSLLEYGRTLWPELASGDVALSSLSTAGGSVGGGADRDSSSNSSSSSGGDSSSAGGLSGRPVQAKAVAVEPPRGIPAPPGSPAADFEAWAREQGVGSAITIASFGALRGCAAARDVQPGEPLLSIPSDVLIYEDSVRQTDLVGCRLAVEPAWFPDGKLAWGACDATRWAAQPNNHCIVCPHCVQLQPECVHLQPVCVLQGRMLMAIPGLTIDNLLIIFTMIDRQAEWHSVNSTLRSRRCQVLLAKLSLLLNMAHMTVAVPTRLRTAPHRLPLHCPLHCRHDPDSKWARYWRSLPDKYYTGASAGTALPRWF